MLICSVSDDVKERTVEWRQFVRYASIQASAEADANPDLDLAIGIHKWIHHLRPWEKDV